MADKNKNPNKPKPAAIDRRLLLEFLGFGFLDVAVSN